MKGKFIQKNQMFGWYLFRILTHIISNENIVELFSRYIAVHNPLDYNQAMNDENAIRTRLLKYLLPVVIASIAFNIPKFFESKVSYVPVNVTEMVSIML